MIHSQPILPIRFYSDLHDQDRFNIFHRKFCDSYLNYPPNGLPAFQITKPQSLAEPEHFILKNICNETTNFDKLIPEQASNFGKPGTDDYFGEIKSTYNYDNGVDPPELRLGVVALSDCGKLKNQPPPSFGSFIAVAPYGTLIIPTPLENYYTLKVVVDKIQQSGGSAFSIKVYNDTILLGVITTPGVYTYYFKSVTSSNTTVVFDSFQDGDEFELSYIQCVLELSNQLFLSDVQLDEDDLEIINTTDQTDIVRWCDASQNYNVPPGTYYFFVQYSDGTYSYSELFNVRSYREIEKFYKLTWWNSSDINGQIFYDPDTFPCRYKNVIYLEAALFKPEYETLTENVKNGENDDVPVFNKWQKSITLQMMNAPEFLADSLSAIFLHDNIYLRNPLNNKQEIQSEEYQILKSTSEISSILNDAYQKVELKLMMADKYTKANCSEDVEEFTCDGVYVYKAAASPSNADYYLVITNPTNASDGLFLHEDDSLVEPEPTDIIYDYDNDTYFTLELIAGTWQKVTIYPSITSSTIVGSEIIIVGKALPNTFAKVQYNYDSGGWVDSEIGEVDSLGNFTIAIPLSLTVGSTDFDVRIYNISRTCTFAISVPDDLDSGS